MGQLTPDDFAVYVRNPGQAWEQLFVYEAKVDMHHVRQASMAYFDMSGRVEVRIESLKQSIQEAVIRPLSANLSFEHTEKTLSFTLDRPLKLSVEINGERFSNLHLFANPIETDTPDPVQDHVLLLKPAIHRTEDIYRLLATPKVEGGNLPDTIYFAPGMHYLEQTLLQIPSDTTVYIAGGAIVVGSMVCDHVKNVSIRGRGILYLSDFHRFSAFRGIRIVFSENISVEGIITLDPPHYSIYLGQSKHVHIQNFKSFSTRGWSDGIDMMSCSHIDIDDVFLRTSDDCIAIYGSRWDYYGDTSHITVRNSVLWADVAHPLMIGTHGNHRENGDIIEDILFENIDILEHHEPQPNYMGALAINAGDNNSVRNVVYRNIRVENIELGRLIDLRVIWNKDYNPVPGFRIENISFEDITYNGDTSHPSQIFGYDEERTINNISFTRLSVNGRLILQPESGFMEINEFTRGVSFDA
ncbi:glycosyl hydrolase family 28 protein [Paenibacillus sp. FSL H8-0259]|uniref:glycosyl hydrolase family 28 protein n=1 Tax=Paenibacillus sp. FSL H8-0259 TaxID=1920423 RepID=UPI0021168A3A|nr:glycosyl hydrolase family 28 protein [Paenibacillus sp. FSL H8-0259]